MKKVLVFVGMKHFANRVVEKLESNRISSAAIHGNKSQNARQNALEDFSRGRVRVLVATDIASRGIDVDGISHVINFDLPNAPEDYVHRIGRTARAGNDGSAVSFCTGDEKSLLVHIEKTTRQTIRVDDLQPYHSSVAAEAQVMKPGRAKALIEGERRKEGRSHRSANRSKPKSGRRSGGGQGGGKSASRSDNSAAPRSEKSGSPRSDKSAAPRSENRRQGEGSSRSGGAPFRSSRGEGAGRNEGRNDSRSGSGRSAGRSRRPSRSR